MSTPATQTLFKYFGFSSFRPPQAEVVEAILSHQDVLALLPTGGGKSLCYQIPGLLLPGSTLVISPLIALMKDQVENLQKKGINATYFNSSLSSAEQQKTLSEIAEGKFTFIYVSPERLETAAFRDLFVGKYAQSLTLSLIAVDEAHCITEWGHSFRPSYFHIPRFISALPQRPVIAAFTATATRKTQTEICEKLLLSQPKIFQQQTHRPNLFISTYSCHSRREKEIFLQRILKKHTGQTGIIYCSTQQETQNIAELVNYLGYKAAFYHGGLSSESRTYIQDRFIHDDVQIIAATNAFGMGIDKGSIRFVIHYNLPSSIENYSQEIGRAGRDSLPANCYLLYHPRDVAIQEALLLGSEKQGTPLQKTKDKEKLAQLVRIIESRSCIPKHLALYFGDQFLPQKCGHCDRCQVHNSLDFNTQEQAFLKTLLFRRQKVARHFKISESFILPTRTLECMVTQCPQSEADMIKIPGIGKGWIKKWGKYFLNIELHV